MITLGKIVDWVVTNRRGKAFQNYGVLKIANEIDECFNNGDALCVTDKTGIVGVCCGKRDNENKTLYIYDILTTKPGVIKKMVAYFIKNYPGYTLKGKVRNRTRILNNPTKLYNRL